MIKSLPQTQTFPSISWNKIFFGLLFLLIASGLRSIPFWISVDSLEADPDAYRALAEGLHRSGTFGRIGLEGTVSPTAYRPPLYPWWLSWLVDAQGRLPTNRVALLHAFLGGATTLIVWRVAQDLLKKYVPQPTIYHWFAIAVGLGVTVDPLLVQQSRFVMTETIATLWVVLLWYLWIKLEQYHGLGLAWYLGFGLVAGLSLLLRPTNLVWISFWIILWLARDRAKSWRPVGMVVVGTLLCVVPWAIRNHHYTGRWIFTTTHGGYTLLLANNPVLYDHIEKEGANRAWRENSFHAAWARRHQSDPFAPDFWTSGAPSMANAQTKAEPTLIRQEVTDDQLAQRVAIQTIYQRPFVFLQSCIIRILWLWNPFPYRSEASAFWTIMIGVWYLVVYGLAVIGLWKIRSKSSTFNSSHANGSWLPCLALVISLMLVHSLYWTNIRMRAPIMPAVYMLASLGAIPTAIKKP